MGATTPLGATVANLLLNPSNWTDQDGQSPPACWNGSSYFGTTTPGLLEIVLTLNSSVVVSAGDYIAATASRTAYMSPAATVTYGNYTEQWALTSAGVILAAAMPTSVPSSSVTIVLNINGDTGDSVTLTPLSSTLPSPSGNLLLDPSNWTDQDGHSPPACWTGSAYASYGDTIYYTGSTAIAEGSSISAAVDSEFDGGSVTVAYSGIDRSIVSTVRPYSLSSLLWPSAEDVYVQFNGYESTIFLTPTFVPTPGPGFMLATEDSLSPSSGPGALMTFVAPVVQPPSARAASYVRTPRGMAAVFYGGSPVYTLPLPEDVGAVAYRGAPKQRFVWRSKKFVFASQTTMAAAKVVHDCSGGGVRFRLYVDCCCVWETVVRGCVPFRLPDQLRGLTWEVEILGCSRVTEVVIASSMRELLGSG